MEPDCRALLVDRIRLSGPVTVAEYIEVALYAPGAGYYARAARRSGRAGDFVTSVDVGPLLGELLAVQLIELCAQLPGGGAGPAGWDLVEAGAGNGRLSRDILDALSRRAPRLYEGARLTLVERSEPARAGQTEALGPHAHKLAAASPDLPGTIRGILVANELLDAFPVHLVTMTAAGMREVYVDAEGESLVVRLGPPSCPRLVRYFDDLGITLEPGSTVEVNLAAVDWIHDVGSRLSSGYVLLIDYGYEATTMYAEPGAVPTLTAFARQMADPPPGPGGRGGEPPWLVAPGTRDLTSHVDFTTLRREAARAGLSTLRVASQSRFLLDLVERGGLIGDLDRPDRLRDRLALKSLVVPGGLGSSHTVHLFGSSAAGVR